MSSLQARIRSGRFVITAEIVPPLSGNAEKLLREASLLRNRVDAVNVTDSAAGRTAVSSFAAAAILAANGYEPVAQVTCRDRNRVALAGELLGASAQGIHNVLVLTGDDLMRGDQPDARPVFDLSATQLLALARDMRDRGMLPSGRTIDPPPNFFLGAVDTPRFPDSARTSSALAAKLDAGAGFIQTQFCFDLDLARAYLGWLRGEGITQRAGVIIGVGPISSARSARWMNENLFGVAVPQHVVTRLEQAGDPAAEGVRICSELIARLQEIDGVAGVHIMAPARGTEAIAEVLEIIGRPVA